MLRSVTFYSIKTYHVVVFATTLIYRRNSPHLQKIFFYIFQIIQTVNMKTPDIESLDFIEFDADSRMFSIKGKRVFLRNKEFSLLHYFLQNMGRVLSRTQILEDVWDRNIICPTNTVDVHVSSLRRKFKRYADKECIKTIHCVGYMFNPHE